jgi:DNA-binding NarL/FixJ family response regulator
MRQPASADDLGVRAEGAFMSISISSSLANVSSAAANASSNAATAQTATPPANDSTDTVKLSQSQQVHQLYNQGQSISQIAYQLILTVETVNGYLNVSNT